MTKRQRLGYAIIRDLNAAQRFVYEHVIQDMVWVSQSGHATPVRSLERSHLSNIMRMLERNVTWLDTPLHRAVWREAIRRGMRSANGWR